ncbi:MAG: thymidine phosphorylase [Synergistaceae bacterium]|nr:thymidine phosphorylase [Synergistaceae bacterium]
MSSALDFIERKRDGGAHSRDEFEKFVMSVRDGATPDYQISAWLMAAYLNGLSVDETAWFTEALAGSGDIVKIPSVGSVVDKHSTGGVGDKTTLIVAPLAAACGLRVAKLSGRGLGFTGGTVDKLESIPGMDVHLSTDSFIDQVSRIGIALSGHSLALAPAEGRFYSLRDVTGTVPSLPLIASSIVSKKIAGGADSFVFDVKCGSGAFMRDREDAFALARALVDLSSRLGRSSVCIISDMEQPLGEWVGNSLEVVEAVEVLSGSGPADTRELSIVLAAEMLVLGGVSEDADSARGLAERRLDDGAALAKFEELITAQGGDKSVCRSPRTVLPMAAKAAVVRAPHGGIVERLDAKAVGVAVRALGGGRAKHDDAVDPAVGVRLARKIGDRVSDGEAIIEILYNDDAKLAEAAPLLEGACGVGTFAPGRSLVIGRVT